VDAADVLEVLAATLPVSVVLLDRSGRVVAVNSAYVELMGRMPPPGFNALDDAISIRHGVAALFRHAIAGGGVQRLDAWYDPAERGPTEPRAGTPMFVALTLVPIVDAGGGVPYVAVVTRDLTDVQRARDDIERQRDQLRTEVAQQAAVEGELRASEAVMATAQRINRIGSWEFDLDDLDNLASNPLRWSDEVYRIYGYQPDAVEPSVDAFLRLVHPDDRPRMGEALRSALHGTGRYELDVRVRRPDGAERIIHSEAMVQRDRGGAPRRVIGTIQDVTEQRLADAVLRESEERLEMALIAGRMFAWEVEIASGRLYLSRNAGEVLGLTAGWRVDHLIDLAPTVCPDDLDAIRAALVSAGDGPSDIAFRITRPLDGRAAWIRVRSHRSEGSAAATRVRGLAIDITEQKRLDDALRASEARYRTLVESAPEAIVVLDLDLGHFVEVNASALRMFGLSRDEICRVGPGDLSPPTQPDGRPSAEAAYDHLGEALAGGHPTFEWVHRDARGRDIACEIRLARIPSEDRRLVRGSILDISARKRLEQMRARSAELEVQNRRIREASRLKSEFLANMSHELRTPLNAIIGFAELLHDGQVPAEAPQFREFLGDILASGRHLLQLINDVLDLSKIEAGKTEFRAEAIDLARVFGEVVAILRTSAARRRIAVTVDIAPSLVDIRLDPARLKQVLYNYLSNALKFTEPGGRVAVRAIPDGDERLRIEVADTGIGIAAEHQGKLFVEFQQVDASHRLQGTGLGLALTRRLVEAQGGGVGVVSAPGVGSTFSAVLPRRFGGEVTRRGRATTGSPVALRRVLVVDDDPADQQAIADALTAAGFDVVTAGTGAEALTLCREHAFDAATIDLLLPDFSGLELIRDLRASARGRALPLVVITVLPEATTAGFGVVEVLRKPVDPAQLVAALARAGVEAAAGDERRREPP
jgi:PAS domain S-box-containing protein